MNQHLEGENRTVTQCVHQLVGWVAGRENAEGNLEFTRRQFDAAAARVGTALRVAEGDLATLKRGLLEGLRVQEVGDVIRVDRARYEAYITRRFAPDEDGFPTHMFRTTPPALRDWKGEFQELLTTIGRAYRSDAEKFAWGTLKVVAPDLKQQVLPVSLSAPNFKVVSRHLKLAKPDAPLQADQQLGDLPLLRALRQLATPALRDRALAAWQANAVTRGLGLQQYARLRDANPFASQWVPGKEFFLESGARPLSKDDWMAVQALFEAAKSTFVIKANADLGQPMPALHVVEVNAEGREVPGKQPRNPTRAELIGLHETVACKFIAKLVVLSRAPDATPANVVRGWLQSLNERDVSLFRWPTLKVKKEAVAIQQRRFARAGGEEETYRTDEPVKAPRLYFSFPLALRYLLNAAESVLGRRMPKFLEGGYSLIGTTLMLGGADRVLLEFVGRIMDFEADPTKPRWAVHRAIYGDDSLAVILERSEDGPTRATLVAADFSRMDLRVPTNMFWLIFLRANQLLPLTGAEQVALRLWAFWLQGPTGVVWEDSIFNHQGGFRSGISGIAYANSFVTEHLYEILETFLERGAPALTAWRQAKEFMKDHLGCVVEDEVPPISLEVDGNFDPDGPLMTAFTQMPLLGGHFRLHRGAGGDVNFVHLIKEERLLKHLVCPTGPKTVRPERIIGIALSGLFYEHYDSLRKLYQRFYVTKEEVGTLADEDDAAMFGALLSPEGTLPHEFPTWERFLEVHLVPRAPPAPPRSEVGVKPDFELVVPPSFNVISGVRRRVKTVRTQHSDVVDIDETGMPALMLVTPDTSLAPERVSTRKQLNARELPGVPVALTSSFDAHVAALRARYQTTSSKRGRQKGAKQTWEHGRPATPSEGEAEDEEDEYWEGEKAALEAEERDEERAVAAVRRALRQEEDEEIREERRRQAAELGDTFRRMYAMGPEERYQFAMSNPDAIGSWAMVDDR